MKYIILLRGINISGKNKIVMTELKRDLEKYYQNVKTYLNSGNVILETDDNEKDIINKVHLIILNSFNLDIPIYVIEYDKLVEIVNNAPNWWGSNNKEIYDDLIFIIEPYTLKEVIEDLGVLNNGIEKGFTYNNVIFWSYDLKDYCKSYWWIKSAKEPVKDKITIRTANTIKKLIELADK